MSPVIWTTIATGTTPQEHGIEGFVNRLGRGPEPGRLYTNRDRRKKAFWNILDDHDRTTAVVGWWLTHPVERIRGVMVAQTNTVKAEQLAAKGGVWKGLLIEGVADQVWPPDLEEEMLGLVPVVEHELPNLVRDVLGQLPGDPGPVVQQLIDRCLWAFRADEIYRRAGLAVLRQVPDLDLLAIYLGGPDVMGHRFWRYFEPESFQAPPTPEEVRAYGDFIPRYYAQVDRVLGELIEAAGPHVDVIVISDHGMHAVNRLGRFTPDLSVGRLRSGGHPDAPPGVIVASGPSIRSAASSRPVEGLERDDLPVLGSVFDVTPTLLTMLDVPVGLDMRGEPLKTLLAPALIARRPGPVDTHTAPGWHASHWAGSRAPADDPERVEQLRALGYLED